MQLLSTYGCFLDVVESGAGLGITTLCAATSFLVFVDHNANFRQPTPPTSNRLHNTLLRAVLFFARFCRLIAAYSTSSYPLRLAVSRGFLPE